MVSFLRLIRYNNLLMVIITMVLTKYALLHSFNPEGLTVLQFIFLALSVVLITAGGYIINDILDITTDTINKPNRVFIQTEISKKTAWISYFLITLIGVFIGIYLSFFLGLKTYSFLFVITSISLYLYSKYFKKLPLLGNLLVASLVSLTIYIVFLFDVVSKTKTTKSHDVYSIVLLFVVFSFLTTFIRELIKDIEDINGDYQTKMKTLPILIGRFRTNRTAFFLSGVLCVLLSFTMRFSLEINHLFIYYILIFILFPIGYFMYKLWNSKTKKNYSFLSNLMKLIMFFGIISMFLFKF